MSILFGADLFAALHEGARMKSNAPFTAKVDFRLAIRRLNVGRPWMNREMISGPIEDPPPVIRMAFYSSATITRKLVHLHGIALEADPVTRFGSGAKRSVPEDPT
jgi:hypothetical protein